MSETFETRVTNLAARRSSASEQTREPRSWDLADMALAVRWGALCFAVISFFAPFGATAGRGLRRDSIASVVLVLYGVARTLQPIRSTPRRTVIILCALEAALCTAVALVTGAWSSPMLLMVGSALLIAGLLGGLSALAVAAATVLVFVGIGEALGTLSLFHGVRSALAAQRVPELVGMGVIGAYAHRVFSAEGGAYNRLRAMNEIHALIFELYSLAAEHPRLFTVEGAVNATVSRLRDVLAPDVVVLLLRHPTAEGAEQPWEVMFSEGMSIASRIADDELPESLVRCAAAQRPEVYTSLPEGTALDPTATTGLYAPIVVRETLIGLLALERRRPPSYAVEDREVLKEITRHAGIAIDNARSYLRLRNLGAEEERERIARELHDRVGQSLAAIAFNIDRLAASLPVEAPEELGTELDSISSEVRVVNGEVREKLAELRGGPTESLDLVRELEGFLVQVETRSGLKVSFDHHVAKRLPDIVEREIWRIACEAIRNVERHSGARHLAVSLLSDTVSTVLEVSDDGQGISRERTPRPDAYGIVGMRERADLIDATLVVDSAPQCGTTVRVRVPRRQ